MYIMSDDRKAPTDIAFNKFYNMLTLHKQKLIATAARRVHLRAGSSVHVDAHATR